MIQKLLLVRTLNSRSALLDDAGVKANAGEPLNVSPTAWADEHGLSHYGFSLTNLTLKQFNDLETFVKVNDGMTLLDHDGDVTASLAAVGLRINESA